MRFEQAIEIDAPQQRVWDVLTDIEAWPHRIDTVDAVEMLTPAPLGAGSRVRLRQPKLPEGTWEISSWDPPASFEWVSKSSGMTLVAGHRVEPTDDGRSCLTLMIDMRGLLAGVLGRASAGLTNDYMSREALAVKRAAERT